VNPVGCGHVSSEISNGFGGPADYPQYIEDCSLSSTLVDLQAECRNQFAMNPIRLLRQ